VGINEVTESHESGVRSRKSGADRRCLQGQFPVIDRQKEGCHDEIGGKSLALSLRGVSIANRDDVAISKIPLWSPLKRGQTLRLLRGHIRFAQCMVYPFDRLRAGSERTEILRGVYPEPRRRTQNDKKRRVRNDIV